MAATTMQIEHVAMAATSSRSAGSADASMAAPCADGPAIALHATHDPDAVAVDHAGAAGGAHQSPDCCPASTCDCDCIVHVLAPVTMPVLDDPMVARSTGVRPMTTGHPEPAHAQLIRPPIG